MAIECCLNMCRAVTFQIYYERSAVLPNIKFLSFNSAMKNSESSNHVLFLRIKILNVKFLIWIKVFFRIDIFSLYVRVKLFFLEKDQRQLNVRGRTNDHPRTHAAIRSQVVYSGVYHSSLFILTLNSK